MTIHCNMNFSIANMSGIFVIFVSSALQSFCDKSRASEAGFQQQAFQITVYKKRVAHNTY